MKRCKVCGHDNIESCSPMDICRRCRKKPLHEEITRIRIELEQKIKEEQEKNG